MEGSAYLELNNCLINDVYVGLNGLGVITIRQNSVLKMTNTTIQKTYITGPLAKSGGVYVDDPNTKAMLYNCTFKDIGSFGHKDSPENRYAEWGGAIKSYGTLYCDGCNFINCTAEYGAAIYIQDSTSHVNIQNSNFINCKAMTSGIIYLEGKNINDVRFTNCSFIDNKVIKKDGVIYLEGENIKDVRFTNCSFIDNQVKRDGIIYLNNAYDAVSLTDCSFINNRIGRYGLFYCDSTDQAISLTKCSFINNILYHINEGSFVFFLGFLFCF